MNKKVKVNKTISNGIPKKDADPYEKGWVYATKGEYGLMVKKHDGQYTVFFPKSETATFVDNKYITPIEW